MAPPSTDHQATPISVWAVKPIVFVLAILCFVFVYWQYGDLLNFHNLAQYEQSLRDYERHHPWHVALGAFVLYVAISGLSIPGGAVALSIAYGSYFGWLKAIAIVSFGSTAGATVAFLISRYLFHDFVQTKFANRLIGLNEKLEEEGAFYLFSLRLIVAVPFFVLNLLMGLTNIKWTTYWWVSQLGMLPGTMAYVYAGSTLKLHDLAQYGFQGVGWQTLLAFGILGVLPIIIKKVMGNLGKGNKDIAATT